MRLPWIGLACSLASVAIGPGARADWQYTHWGMTPEQVVAASGGKATLLAERQRRRLPPFMTAATGTFQDGALALSTSFTFDIASSGLRCVFYGVMDAKDNAALEAALTARFGKPQRVGGLPGIGMRDLGWVTPTDQINASFPSEDVAFVEHCARKT